MLETALRSFTTFFATVGPIEAAVLFATLTPKMAHAERQAIAMRATLIASTILAFFTLLGGPILNQLGVSIAALQTAGGVILFGHSNRYDFRAAGRFDQIVGAGRRRSAFSRRRCGLSIGDASACGPGCDECGYSARS